MDIRLFAAPEQLAHAAARRVLQTLRARTDVVIGAPAGRTPIGVYAELARFVAVGQADFARATVFALDEFVGIDGNHPASFRRFIREQFAEPVGISHERCHALNGMAVDLEAECRRYDEAIAHAGGIGLQLLGIGGNGHVGFNEPAEELIAHTHRVTLLEETRKANASLFDGDPARVPRHALTMGIGTILKADSVLLLATGQSKAASVERMVRGPITPRLPASFLQAHRSVELYLDQAAASRL